MYQASNCLLSHGRTYSLIFWKALQKPHSVQEWKLWIWPYFLPSNPNHRPHHRRSNPKSLPSRGPSWRHRQVNLSPPITFHIHHPLNPPEVHTPTVSISPPGYTSTRVWWVVKSYDASFSITIQKSAFKWGKKESGRKEDKNSLYHYHNFSVSLKSFLFNLNASLNKDLTRVMKTF